MGLTVPEVLVNGNHKEIKKWQDEQKILETKKEGFLVAARVLDACGLLDTLGKIQDEKYEKLYRQGLIPDYDATKNSWVFPAASGHQ